MNKKFIDFNAQTKCKISLKNGTFKLRRVNFQNFFAIKKSF